MNAPNPRLETSVGSSWRNAPAAALRGLTNSSSPASSAVLVHLLERRARQIDLASHFDATRHRFAKPQWNGADRPHVVRHVLPGRPVTACGGTHEHALFVGERDAQAVDLQLRDVVDRVRHDAGVGEALAHALVERPELGLVVGVVETEHRLGVADLVELLADAAAHALRWRVGRDERRMLLLELQELAQQIVELRVTDLRLVGDVIALFVVADEPPELGDA